MDESIQISNTCFEPTNTFDDFEDSIGYEAIPNVPVPAPPIDDSLIEEDPDVISKKICEFYNLHCNACNIGSFDTLQQYKAHRRIDHNDKNPGVNCCSCGQLFHKKWILIDHMYLHLDPKHLTCPDCGKTSNNRTSYMAHMKIHADPQKLNRRYQCDICTKRFDHLSLMRKHMLKHISAEEKSTMGRFPCPDCDKKFIYNSMLKAHVRYWHSESSVAFVCHICAREFKLRINYNYHMNNVHNKTTEKMFECPEPGCGKKFMNERQVVKHRRLCHENVEHVGPQICEHCNKQFTTLVRLRAHIKFVHQQRHDLKCQVCDKGFKTKLTLKEHLACHNGIPLYKCNFCERTFNSNANMYSHRKRMHPELLEQYKSNNKK